MPPKPLRKPTRKEALALPQNARFAFLSEVSQFLASEGYLNDASYFGSQALKAADAQGAFVPRRCALQHCEVCGVFLAPWSCARIECVDLSSRTQRRAAAARTALAGPGGASGSKGPSNVVAVVRFCKVCGHRNSQPLSSAHGARQLAESEARLLEDFNRKMQQPQRTQQDPEQQQQEGRKPIIEEVLQETEQQQAVSDTRQQGLPLDTTDDMRVVQQLQSNETVVDLTANTVTVGVPLPGSAENQEAATSFTAQAEVAAITAANGVEGGLAVHETGVTSMDVVATKDVKGSLSVSDGQMYEELLAASSDLSALAPRLLDVGADADSVANQIRNAAIVLNPPAEGQGVGSGKQTASNVEPADTVGVMKLDGQEDGGHDPNLTHAVLFEALVLESGSMPKGPEPDVRRPDDAQYVDDGDVTHADTSNAAAEEGMLDDFGLGRSSVQTVMKVAPANTDKVSTDQADVDMPEQQWERQASEEDTQVAHCIAVRGDERCHDALIVSAGQAGRSGDPMAGADRKANRSSEAIVEHTASELAGARRRDDPAAPDLDTGLAMEAATEEPSANVDSGVRLQGTLGLLLTTPANADEAAGRANDVAAVNAALKIDAVTSKKDGIPEVFHTACMKRERLYATTQFLAPDGIQLNKPEAYELALGKASMAEEDQMTRCFTESGPSDIGNGDETSAVALTEAVLGMTAYEEDSVDIGGSEEAAKGHEEAHSGEDKEAPQEVLALASHGMSNLWESDKHKEGTAMGGPLPAACIALSGSALGDPGDAQIDHSGKDSGEEIAEDREDSDEDDEAPGTKDGTAEKPASSPEVLDLCGDDDEDDCKDDDECSGKGRSAHEIAAAAELGQGDSSHGQVQRKSPQSQQQQQQAQQSALKERKETQGIGIEAAAVLTRRGAHVSDGKEIDAAGEVALPRANAASATEVVDVTRSGESKDEDGDEEQGVEVELTEATEEMPAPGEEEENDEDASDNDDESGEGARMLSEEEEGIEADESDARNSDEDNDGEGEDEEEDVEVEEKEDAVGHQMVVAPALPEAAFTQPRNQRSPQHKPVPPVQQPVIAKMPEGAFTKAADADFAAALVALEATEAPSSVKRRRLQTYELEPQRVGPAPSIQPIVSKLRIQDLPTEEDKQSRMKQQRRQIWQASSKVEREVVVPELVSGAAMERPERRARVLTESGTAGKRTALLSEAPLEVLRTRHQQSQLQQQPKVQSAQSEQTSERQRAKPNWLPEGYVSKTSIHPLLPKEREDGVLVYEAPYAPGLFDLRPVVELEWPRVLHHPRHRRRFLRDRALYAAHNVRFAIDQPQPQAATVGVVSLGAPDAVNPASAAVAPGERRGHNEQRESVRGGRLGVTAGSKAALGRGDRVPNVHVGGRAPKAGRAKPAIKDKLRLHLEMRAQQRARPVEEDDDISEDDAYEASSSDQDNDSELRHLPRRRPLTERALEVSDKVGNEEEEEEEEEDGDWEAQEQVPRRQGVRRVGTNAKQPSLQKGRTSPLASAVAATKRAAFPTRESLVPRRMDEEPPQPQLLKHTRKGLPTHQPPLPQKKRRVHWAVTDSGQQHPEHQPRKEGSEVKRKRA